MGDNPTKDLSICTGLLNCKLEMSNVYEKYYLSPDKSDVTLLVNGSKISAHRFILMAESTYFTQLLAGDDDEVEVADISLPAVHLILQYMYCMDLDLSKQRLEVLQEVLDFGQAYELPELSAAIGQYVDIKSKGVKSVTNCWYPEHLETTDNTYAASNEILIDDQVKECIQIEFSLSTLINHVTMDIREKIFDGYEIHVSEDAKKWKTVLNYSGYPCNQEQYVYFPELKARFMRIVSNHFYRCNSFKAEHTEEVPMIRDGYVCPPRFFPIQGQVYDKKNIGKNLQFCWTADGKSVTADFFTSPKIYFNQPYCLNRVVLQLFNAARIKDKVFIVKLLMAKNKFQIIHAPVEKFVFIKFLPCIVHSIFIEAQDDYEPRIFRFEAFFDGSLKEGEEEEDS